MKKVILSLWVLLFFLFPMLSSSAEKENKESKGKKIVEMKPDKKLSEEYIMAGKQFIENFHHEKAVLSFKKALLYNPFSAEAYYGLGYCYKRLGLYDNAIKELRIGLKYERLADSLALLGLIYKFQGKYDQSKDLFFEALTKKPHMTEIITWLEEMEKVDKELMIEGKQNSTDKK